MTAAMRDELAQGPGIVAGLLEARDRQIREVARAIRGRPVDTVVIAARGTSDHAALYAKYVLGARNGLNVALAAPSLVTLYHAAPRVAGGVVLGISQSGQSPDVVAVLREGREQGALTVALTNDPASDLAEVADEVIELGAGPERAVPATKTYLAEIALIAMLSSALSDDHESRSELAALPSALQDAFGSEAEAERLAGEWATEERCVVLARGFHYATAREWALKLKEVAYVTAEPYSAADFQHGPMALVESGFTALAVATSGPALGSMAEVLRRLAAASARLLVLSDRGELRALDDGLSVPSLPEWLSPLAAIIPAQLFAYHLAIARGIDSNAPRNLAKVTLTR